MHTGSGSKHNRKLPCAMCHGPTSHSGCHLTPEVMLKPTAQAFRSLGGSNSAALLLCVIVDCASGWCALCSQEKRG